MNYESPSVIDCGTEDLQQALEEFPLLARPADIIPTTGDHTFPNEFCMFLKLFLKFFGSGFKIRLHREKVSRRIAELFCCRPYPGDSFDYEVDQSFLYFIT